MRFIFALMVFAAHCYVIDPRFSHFVYKEGFVGVSFFFVLSGFIIAYNYQRKIQQKTVTKREFWIARFARVYPLHLATLLLPTLSAASFCATDGVLLLVQLTFLEPRVSLSFIRKHLK